jgi:hypothetical protein
MRTLKGQAEFLAAAEKASSSRKKTRFDRCICLLAFHQGVFRIPVAMLDFSGWADLSDPTGDDTKHLPDSLIC